MKGSHYRAETGNQGTGCTVVGMPCDEGKSGCCGNRKGREMVQRPLCTMIQWATLGTVREWHGQDLLSMADAIQAI